MISHLDKIDINKYEKESEEDIEMMETKKINSKVLSCINQNRKDETQIIITKNLNEKYNFRLGEINFSDINFFKNKEKLIYNFLEYFKSHNDYDHIRYFSCENNNKKSKKELLKKWCEGKIKIDLLNETAKINKLHSNECLENSFGQVFIIPAINEEIIKRDQIMEFANKLLTFNPAIPLTSFKETI